MQGAIVLGNCRMLQRPEDGKKVTITIRDGRIVRIAGSAPGPHKGEVLDVGGRTVAPGFVDLHIQGAGGADVLDGTAGALETISRTCARFGTTGFLATTVFRPDGDNEHLRVAASNVGRDLGGANLLGIHLEGPFISTERRGMIHPSCICQPSEAAFEDILRMTGRSLRIMTIAPELEGSLDIISRLHDSGVVASFGHSSASYEETLEGIKRGITHVTHLFNAMPPLHHRSPGPLLAILERNDLTVQMIADGVHLHPRVLRLAFRLVGRDRAITITDGMQAMGLRDGRYLYNGVEYESRGGVARYMDGTLIGTGLGMSQMIKRLVEFSGCSLEAAVGTATRNPARATGLGGKGEVAVGKDGDLVVLNPDSTVWATIVGGRIVYRA